MVFITGIKFMKPSLSELAKAAQIAVLPQTLHRVRTRTNGAAPNPKAQKRDNIFSQSRDTREDRGERQMKTSHNPQTFPHGR
jgi:hypothetical protein